MGRPESDVASAEDWIVAEGSGFRVVAVILNPGETIYRVERLVSPPANVTYGPHVPEASWEDIATTRSVDFAASAFGALVAGAAAPLVHIR